MAHYVARVVFPRLAATRIVGVPANLDVDRYPIQLHIDIKTCYRIGYQRDAYEVISEQT